jgi:hypothetical protein
MGSCELAKKNCDIAHEKNDLLNKSNPQWALFVSVSTKYSVTIFLKHLYRKHISGNLRYVAGMLWQTFTATSQLIANLTFLVSLLTAIPRTLD